MDSDTPDAPVTPTKRAPRSLVLVAVAIAAAILGALITAQMLRGNTTSDTDEMSPPERASRDPDPHEECINEILDGALRLANSRSDREISDGIIMKWGLDSPEYQAIMRAGAPYYAEAMRKGRDYADAALWDRVVIECDTLVGVRVETTTTSTTSTSIAPTPPPSEVGGPGGEPTKAEPLAAVTEVWTAWQSGDQDALRSRSGPNVYQVLGEPDPEALVSGCAEENPPIGSGTPSDPVINFVCTLSTDPPTYLWLGPDREGNLYVWDASLVGD